MSDKKYSPTDIAGDSENEVLSVALLRDSLELSERGNPKPTIGNVVRILKEDPRLKGAICLNELTGRIDIVRNLGWHREGDVLTDTDMAYLTYYIEEKYGISVQASIEKGIQVVSNENRYHPIRDILDRLIWDGTPRVNNMLTHFFGVEKNRTDR